MDSTTNHKSEKALQEEMGGAGVYEVDFNKSYDLANEEWKYDHIPEIMDGANIIDFVDEDILSKLEKLEEEERQELIAEGLGDTDEVLKAWRETEEEIKEMHGKINLRRKLNAENKTMNKTGQSAMIERKRAKSTARVKAEMEKKTGKEVSEDKLRGRSKARKRMRTEMEDVDMDNAKPRKASLAKSLARKSSKSITRSKSVGGMVVDRSKSRVAQSMGRPELQEKAEAKRRKLTKRRNIQAMKGEGDHHIPDWKPKHLYSGKRGAGKTDRR